MARLATRAETEAELAKSVLRVRGVVPTTDRDKFFSNKPTLAVVENGFFMALSENRNYWMWSWSDSDTIASARDMVTVIQFLASRRVDLTKPMTGVFSDGCTLMRLNDDNVAMVANFMSAWATVFGARSTQSYATPQRVVYTLGGEEFSVNGVLAHAVPPPWEIDGATNVVIADEDASNIAEMKLNRDQRRQDN